MQAVNTTSTAHQKKDSMLSIPEYGTMTKNAKLSDQTVASAITARSVSSTGFDPYGDQMIFDWTEGEQLCSEQVRLIETCNGFAEGNAKQHYDFIAPNYEGIFNHLGYPDPEFVAKFAAACAKKLGSGKDLKVLDMACGTGLVGQQLWKQGLR